MDHKISSNSAQTLKQVKRKTGQKNGPKKKNGWPKRALNKRVRVRRGVRNPSPIALPHSSFIHSALSPEPFFASTLSLSSLARSHGQKRKGALSPCLSRLTAPPPHPFSCVSSQLHKATGPPKTPK